MSGAEDLNSFKYVFNAEKLSLQEARVKMTTFINENKQAVFDGIDQNASLKEAVIDGEDFQSVDDFTEQMIQTMVNTVVEVY